MIGSLLVSAAFWTAVNTLQPAEPMYWLGLHKTSFTWENPATCVKASKLGVLASVQKGACKRNLAMMPVIVSASRRTAQTCQDVFKRQRWNCSSMISAPIFKQDIIRGTREQALVSGLAAAALAVGVGRACAEGRIKTCGCGRTSQDPPESDFSWGGCADDVEYGIKAAKAFVSEPFERHKFRANIDIRLHRHNSRAGWRTVRSSWRLQCKCHGVSGSCEMKTCWKILPPLSDVAQKLKLKHWNAEEVEPKLVGRKTKLLPKSNKARFNKDDLVYLVQSPDYCIYNPQHGSDGTKGRRCNATGTDSYGCKAMCCSRGFLTTWEEQKERCNCKFKRCCHVTCDVCKIRTEVHLCL